MRVDSAQSTLSRIVIENTSSEVVGNFWLFRAGLPNAYNLNTLIHSVTRPGASQREKVLALFQLFPQFYENFWPIDTAGILADPSVLLWSVGYGQCNFAAAAFELLCQGVGCKTRRVGLSARLEGKPPFEHNTMEVFFDGEWHFFDPDGRIFFRRADGRVAGVADLQADPDLIRNAPPATGYDRESYAAAFSGNGVRVLNPSRESRIAYRYMRPSAFPGMFRRTMRFDLIPGTRVTLTPEPRGKFFVRSLGAGDKRSRNLGEFPPYASGQIVWTAAPTEVNTTEGILTHNVRLRRVSGDALWEPQDPERQSYVIVPISSPYVIVGGNIRARLGAGDTLPVSYLPFIHTTLYQSKFLHIGNVGTQSAVAIDSVLNKDVPIFGYAVKFTIPREGVAVKSLEIRTDVQHAPKAFPTIERRENRFVFYSSWHNETLAVENRLSRSDVQVGHRLRMRFFFAADE